MAAMLEVSGLSVAYGKHVALDGVSISVGPGEIVVMLGANGAGKSSCLKALGGLIRHLPGTRISLGSIDLARMPAHAIVEAGLALVPEDRGIFTELSVAENLALGAFPSRARTAEAANLKTVVALFPRLGERMGQLARTMSGGERQMLAIGRALMSSPSILLLDEPSLGLSPLVTKELFQALGRIRELGVGVLLVEQNAAQSLEIGNRAYLLANGRIVGEGAAADLRDDPAVRRAYLGGASPSANGRADANGAAPLANGRLVAAMQHTSRPASAQTTRHDHTPGSETVFDVDLLINNAAVKGSRGATFDRLNPMTGQVASRSVAAAPEDAVRAADAAAAAFPAWAEMAPAGRRALLNRAADLLATKASEFGPLMAAETGATAMWAGFNCMLAADMLREAAAMTTQITGEVIPSNVPGNLAMGYRQPVGVVLGIAPWNAPVILGVRAIAMPLACGNTVVLKASELCPGTHRLIGTVLHEAGLPDGVVNVVTQRAGRRGAVVEALIAPPGRESRELHGLHARRQDRRPEVRRAPEARAARARRQGAAGRARRCRPRRGGERGGLRCLRQPGPDLHVDRAHRRRREDRGRSSSRSFAAKAKSLPIGDPRKGKVVLGSLVDRSAAERVHQPVLDAVRQGRQARQPAARSDGTLINAHVLDHVTPQMRIYDEESFGPVTTVVRVKGDEEAIRVANDTAYGLSAAVFSRDIDARLRRGAAHRDRHLPHQRSDRARRGADAVRRREGSGYGRFGGKAAINEFTELRWITIQSGHRHYPF